MELEFCRHLGQQLDAILVYIVWRRAKPSVWSSGLPDRHRVSVPDDDDLLSVVAVPFSDGVMACTALSSGQPAALV